MDVERKRNNRSAKSYNRDDKNRGHKQHNKEKGSEKQGKRKSGGYNKDPRKSGNNKKTGLVNRASQASLQEALGVIDAQRETIENLQAQIEPPVCDVARESEPIPNEPRPQLTVPVVVPPPDPNMPAPFNDLHDLKDFTVHYWVASNGWNRFNVRFVYYLMWTLFLLTVSSLAMSVSLKNLFSAAVSTYLFNKKRSIYEYLCRCVHRFERLAEICFDDEDESLFEVLDRFADVFRDFVCITFGVFASWYIVTPGILLVLAKAMAFPLWAMFVLEVIIYGWLPTLQNVFYRYYQLSFIPVILILILGFFLYRFYVTLFKYKYHCSHAGKILRGDKRPDYMLNQEMKHEDDLCYNVVFNKLFCGFTYYTYNFTISAELYSQLQGLRFLNAFDDHQSAIKRLEAYARNLGTVNMDRYDNDDPFRQQMTVGLAGALSRELQEKLAKAGFPGARL